METRFYDTHEWREMRAYIVARDRNRCTVATLLGGACSGTLHVHHIQPVEEAPHLRLDPSNLGTACASHHGQWEALRRALAERRRPLAPCKHRHPYEQGRIDCARRRARELGIDLPEDQLALVA